MTHYGWIDNGFFAPSQPRRSHQNDVWRENTNKQTNSGDFDNGDYWRSILIKIKNINKTRDFDDDYLSSLFSGP